MRNLPPRYEITFKRRAERALRRLPRDLLARLDAAIFALANEPRPPGVKKLAGYNDLYRIRVGDWRVVYSIEDQKLIVLIIDIGPRGQIYQGLE